MSEYPQMRPTAETRMTTEGQQNAGGQRRTDDGGNPYYDPAPLTEYPRMMYKRTEHEQVQDWADSISTLTDEPMVINRYNGFLCETCIAHSLTEAEALAPLGWDISPAAAYGVEDGVAKEASAKDAEIAELKAQLAAQQAGNEPPPEKRGPGRPRLSVNE